MAADSLKSWRWGTWGVFLLLALLLLALHLLSGAVLRSEALSHWFIPLLVFILAGLVALSLGVAWNLFVLVRDYRRNAAGARLLARTLLVFIVLSIAPVSVVYYYSMQFLMQGIDSWFEVYIDSAMEDALALNQATLNMNKRLLLRYTEQMLEGIDDSSQTALALTLSDLRAKSGALEITLANLKGEILASSNANPDALVPMAPDPVVLQQVVEGKPYAGLIKKEDNELLISCLVADLSRGLVLQAIYPTSERIGALSDAVQQAYVAYRERAYLRESIKFSFILALSLVLLVSVFAAIWSALYATRRMVAPIQALARGTRAIAEGELNGQIPLPRYHDELGFLVASFNTMTRRLAQARDVADRRKRELEFQHEYLEAVLHHLSTGVLALDAQGRLRTANQAAAQILRADVSAHLGQPLSELAQAYPELKHFVDVLEESLRQGEEGQQQELVLYRHDGKQQLICGCTRLNISDGGEIGWVVVFDDVTTLMKAQKDAAWGEVARRLAHEIKNPLTPIQLSAERLRRKYLNRLGEDDKKVLDNATRTIINQVEAMKSMVNAFSDYAKPSVMDDQELLVDPFLSEVLHLYGNAVDFEPGAQELVIQADPVRLRQVVHNLIKNAQEAAVAERPLEIHVATRPYYPYNLNLLLVEITFEDNGSGFEEEDVSRLFEPYVTSKEKGTGLGLAIVKKIIEEHGGSIRAENRPEGGARFIIRLPAWQKHEKGVHES